MLKIVKIDLLLKMALSQNDAPKWMVQQ